MAIRPFKTNRNLAQYAAKKVLGKAHTRALSSDLQENLPSSIQLSAATIFAESIPANPEEEPSSILWETTNTVQYVELLAVEIDGTRYNAIQSADYGGEDTNNTTGPHAWYLKLPADYEDVAAGSHLYVGTAPFVNDTPLYQTLGKLQAVPTNFYINPDDPAINPYTPKIYTWNGKDENTKSTIPLTTNDSLDWFFDPYSGIVFFQEYDGRVPYKVGCYLYVGSFADTGLGGSGGAGGAPTEVGGLSRAFRFITEDTVAFTAIDIPDLDLSGIDWNPSQMSVYLNGQLLMNGTPSQVNSMNADYALTTNGPETFVTFNQPVEVGDIITVLFVQLGSIRPSNFLVFEEEQDLPNARVIVAGDGISIDTTNPREFLISATGLTERIKHHESANYGYIGNPDDGVGDVYTFATNIDFSSNEYNDTRTDIFIDGRLRIKNLHYLMSDGDSSLAVNQIRLLGEEKIEMHNTVSVIMYI